MSELLQNADVHASGRAFVDRAKIRQHNGEVTSTMPDTPR
jgi:hypothetical protein